jgi:hypothetical protein
MTAAANAVDISVRATHQSACAARLGTAPNAAGAPPPSNGAAPELDASNAPGFCMRTSPRTQELVQRVAPTGVRLGIIRAQHQRAVVAGQRLVIAFQVMQRGAAIRMSLA